MNASDTYLLGIVNKYKPRDLSIYTYSIPKLKEELRVWASGCYLNILDSGSRAKGTAISLASDVDYMVSLKNGCNENQGGLKASYDSLYSKLKSLYTNCRKQNVSVRIKIDSLEVDITPAHKQLNSVNDHWIYLSKTDSRRQTNIQKHISDISGSGRINEIKLLKIWRELHRLDFPSIYLEYLVIGNILSYRSKGVDYLASNFAHIFSELAKDTGNPLSARIVDPANSTNILSDLLSVSEKNAIINQAKKANAATNWGSVVW